MDTLVCFSGLIGSGILGDDALDVASVTVLQLLPMKEERSVVVAVETSEPRGVSAGMLETSEPWREDGGAS